MHDEIDLGRYVRVIFRHYRLTLIVFVLVAAAVVGAQFIRPPTYTATATLLAQAPLYQWRFDSRILPSVDVNKNWQREFTELAKDPWVRETIDEHLGIDQNGGPDESVTVRAGRQTLIHVDATATDPQQAKDLANGWAREFISWVDSIYGTSILAQSFEAELGEVEALYREAEAELTEFKSRTGVGIASEGQTMLEGYEWLGPSGLELAEKGRQLAQHRLAVGNLQLLLQEVEDAKREDTSLADLPWALLSVDAIVERGYLTLEDVLVEIDRPGAVEAMIVSELAAQTNVTNLLEEDILEQQATVAELSRQLSTLVEATNLAKENYQTVRRKIDEIVVQSEVEGALLKMINAATLPTEETRTPIPMVALLAIVVGGTAAISSSYVAEYLQTRSESS